ncbi:MAG: Rieske 2Fe-2S domain-containing protein [Actinomycetota bacterium]
MRPTTPDGKGATIRSGFRLYRATEKIERNELLDRPSDQLRSAVEAVVPYGPVKDALSGTWLGHALHPVLTDLPIGAWLSSSLLDFFGGEATEKSSERLIAFGLVAAAPTMASGLADWVDADQRERRVGLIHAATNAAALLLYAASLSARKKDRQRAGTVLGLAGGATVMVGGYLGGHLTLARGVGVDNTAFERLVPEWTRVAAAADFPEDQPLLVDAGGVAVMLVRRAGTIGALANTCSHRGGPLHEGRLSDGCVTCPWHGSQFRMDDGSVVRGPASAPQPAYEVRVAGDDVEVRGPK